MANSTDASTQRSDPYPPSAFHFKLVFAKAPGEDTSFQEVSGIGSEIDVQEVVEGGENRFIHRLPKGVKHPLLSLKRGITDIDSPLVKWCKAVLEGDFVKPIEAQEVKVYLLDENHSPLRGWSFANAYPVKWEIDSFNSTKNEVAIEAIDLSYNYSNRIV
jgi:phage tail-like protein